MNGYTDSTYSVKIQPDSTSGEQALIVHGYDHNAGFASSALAKQLFNSGYDILTIDARVNSVSVQDISEIIQTTGFTQLKVVAINAHGGDPGLVHDTILKLNKNFILKDRSYITASKLLNAIVSKMEDAQQPIKVVINSCHGHLALNKISDILPSGSEVVSFAEDHKEKNGHDYRLTYSFITDNFNHAVLSKDLMRSMAQTIYTMSHHHYHIGNGESSYEIISSPTYSKIGSCISVPPIRLSKDDITTLLSKVPEEEIVQKVVDYLQSGDADSAASDIALNTRNLLHMFQTSDNEYPLLAFRSDANNNKNGEVSEFLGIATAIYGIYDNCSGDGSILHHFQPSQDNAILKATFDIVMDSPTVVANTIIGVISTVLSIVKGEGIHLCLLLLWQSL